MVRPQARENTAPSGIIDAAKNPAPASSSDLATDVKVAIPCGRTPIHLGVCLVAPKKPFVVSKSASEATIVPPLQSEFLLLDIKGAARVLSSTPWTVRALLWGKKIPFIKIGRKFLIDPADLRAFIETQKKAA